MRFACMRWRIARSSADASSRSLPSLREVLVQSSQISSPRSGMPCAIVARRGKRVGAQERLANGLRRATLRGRLPRFVESRIGLAIEERRDVGQSRERQQSLASETKRTISARSACAASHSASVAQRTPPRDARFAERALRLHRDQREDAVELELLEGDGVHAKLLDVRGWRAIPIGAETKRPAFPRVVWISNLYDVLRRVSATLSSAPRSLFFYASCSAFRNAAVFSTRRGFPTSRISV